MKLIVLVPDVNGRDLLTYGLLRDAVMRRQSRACGRVTTMKCDGGWTSFQRRKVGRLLSFRPSDMLVVCCITGHVWDDMISP